jgi:signal transduction histidine kinase
MELPNTINLLLSNISDNGRGFDTSVLRSEDSRGMGLSNIENKGKLH